MGVVKWSKLDGVLKNEDVGIPADVEIVSVNPSKHRGLIKENGDYKWVRLSEEAVKTIKKALRSVS